MSLFIEVYIGSRDNRKLVASTHAYNNSNLADVSDYKFKSNEVGAKHLGIPPASVNGEIKQHNRNQSVWSLVEKIARKSFEPN